MTHESFARISKAQALARTIARVFAPELPSDDEITRIWSTKTWETLAKMASELEGKKIHPPHSKATIEAVVSELRRVKAVA